MPPHPIAGLEFGSKRQSSKYLGVGLELVRNAVAPSTECAYKGHFGSWVEVRLNVLHEPVFLQFSSENPMENFCSLLEYAAYAVAAKKLQADTVESHLSAIKFFHRSSRGFELDTSHTLLRNALKCSARSHAATGLQPRVRRPVLWSMLLGGEHLSQTWGVGGRILWLALGAYFFFLTRSTEMFAETRTRAHE